MGTYCHIAVCQDCREKRCKGDFHGWYEPEDGTFAFPWEWYTRKQAIEVITNLECPCCGSQTWGLTDGGNR
jgi:hypothetical protein